MNELCHLKDKVFIVLGKVKCHGDYLCNKYLHMSNSMIYVPLLTDL